MCSIKQIVLGGNSGNGKTFLIERLLKEAYVPVYGYMTLMHRENLLNEKGYPVFIYPAGIPSDKRIESEENFLGYCNKGVRQIDTSVFSGLGVKLLSDIPEKGIAVMDELGYFEADVTPFTDKVFEVFSGNSYIIASVKERYDIPFLNKIRSLPGILFKTVTPENRDALFEELAPIVRSWK